GASHDRLVEHLEVDGIRGELHPVRLHLVRDDLGRLQPIRLAGTNAQFGHELLATFRGDSVRADGPTGLLHQLLGLVDILRVLDGRRLVVGPGRRDDVAPERDAGAALRRLDDRVLVQGGGEYAADQDVAKRVAGPVIHADV